MGNKQAAGAAVSTVPVSQPTSSSSAPSPATSRPASSGPLPTDVNRTYCVVGMLVKLFLEPFSPEMQAQIEKLAGGSTNCTEFL